MIISQHSFCPLGFIPSKVYNDSMELVSNSNNFTSVLSPCYGSHFVQFTSSDSKYFRVWVPFTKSVESYVTFVLKSTFLFARTFSNSSSFHVVCLTF